ncbi:lysophospholipid acyltransferase family protein [Bordetella avium]|uniref:1-acyl-sn-glycerol-3-phosphate acyltransferase alpha n=1 Tax=Bordetella avium (strain 197N) TaxID=360910 RepID=Q2KX80_BORA1|nr:lysophospholipid acyltransferase family protein [Bordetella avium]AZY48248.1 1-acyl-sn-glycerol-3-phosphate acyltransferase [Bordetella avium]RIQ48948.1 1-acyl-sn-glycerol-3-phosphate acyltransferase [Bordetella avium]RIQ67540.1 1-acyl-sn-glycerol-3-phosphate acyltransferase [Bordetella avium]RIQ74817.1 1-acyl-sn-glycerol-3-phosphate acyltransferase [Bordetella avium]CAJ48312.1 putative 1-acyl-sn-glycerol-3-phosphate acyltransferase alpha [Bordetella avium 197N]
MAWLRSFLYALFLTITVIPYAFACILWAPLPQRWRYKLTVGWPRLAIWGAKVFCGIRWRIKGGENLPDGPIVLLSKHQSAWETLFFPAHMPRQVCFVYKKSLHWVPFFGWGLALLRMIPIDRAKGRDAFEQVVREGGKCLADGRWPLLFPEGTRVAPGQMGRFKMGGALLASRNGAAVVPVALNAGECWRRNAFVKRPGLVTVSFGPPIPSEGLSPDELNARVHAWIDAEMRQLNPERYGQH